jgi:hypothetical protein
VRGDRFGLALELWRVPVPQVPPEQRDLGADEELVDVAPGQRPDVRRQLAVAGDQPLVRAAGRRRR